jgi:hypothetical protein
MSPNFEKVKKYYDRGLWDINRVHRAVGLWITEEEYFEITGCVYPSKVKAVVVEEVKEAKEVVEEVKEVVEEVKVSEETEVTE